MHLLTYDVWIFIILYLAPHKASDSHLRFSRERSCWLPNAIDS